ncbi:MAG TPA: hypothetical protein PKK00_07180 [Bacteroidales bacterium]|nr:hypothetical protein [Bacteroidales bacterium]HPS17115.1 hypothetical protein [Bacteroidales bacterium]
MDNNITSIFWYLSWPVLIFLSYKIIRLVLNAFEKKEKTAEQE